MKDVIYLSPEKRKARKAISLIEAKNDLEGYIQKLNEGHDALCIQSKSGNALLVSEEHYEQLVETLRFLAVPDFIKNLPKNKSLKGRNQEEKDDE